ncbi:MAG: hypothetical protein ACI97A_001338 [Planctomycetota bacterium]|jgi:hypothetical protein
MLAALQTQRFSCTWLPMMAILFFNVAAPSTSFSQSEEAKPKDHREQAAIKEVRSGTWKYVKVEQLVRRMITAGNRHAARWWTEFAVDAATLGYLPKTTKKNLTILGKVNGLKPAEPQLRAMPARALKHLKKMSSLKCYSAMPQAVHFARKCLDLYPDAKMAAKVDALEATLERIDRSEEKEAGKAILKAGVKLRESLAKARDELLADMVAQYKQFPCPPGARAIRALILAEGEASVSQKWRQAWDDVLTIEQAIEPKLKLKIWMENGGKVYVYRFGKRFQATHARSYFGERKQGVTFEVIPGDVIQFEVKKLYAKNGDRKLFVVAASAELAGKPLPSTAWAQNTTGKADGLDPLINPFCRGIEFSPDKLPTDVAEEVIEQAGEIGRGILIPTASEYHHYAVSMDKKLQAAIDAFKTHGQSHTWIAGEAERLAVVLRIPSLTEL